MNVVSCYWVPYAYPAVYGIQGETVVIYICICYIQTTLHKVGENHGRLWEYSIDDTEGGSHKRRGDSPRPCSKGWGQCKRQKSMQRPLRLPLVLSGYTVVKIKRKNVVTLI